MCRTAAIYLPMTGRITAGEQVLQASRWLKSAGDLSWGETQLLMIRDLAGSYDQLHLEPLVQEGVLTRAECDSLDYDAEGEEEELRENRLILLTMAYERSDISRDPAYSRFLKENGWWVQEFGLYLALHRFFGDIDWRQWPEDIRHRYGFALDYYRRELYFDIEFQMYLQFLYFRQNEKRKIG